VLSSAVKETTLPQPSVASSSVQDYVVSPEDILEINVFEVSDISRLYRVSPSGFVELPLLSEPIAAAGLSPSQLSRVIAGRFRTAGLLSNPQVTVAVKETRRHSVVIAGSVKRPQVYPIYGPTRLLQAISESGGLAEDAGRIAVVKRGEIASRTLGPESVSIDIQKLFETGDERLNLLLYPGDLVTVEQAGIVYVIGAVNRPGGYTLKDQQEEMTLLRILALAGDVTNSAKRKNLRVLRKNAHASGGREEVAVDLNKIISGRLPDQLLYSGDVVFVPENAKLKVLRQAVGTGVSTGAGITTGLIIYR
jgi:polysaccharide export outer membrane protein